MWTPSQQLTSEQSQPNAARIQHADAGRQQTKDRSSGSRIKLQVNNQTHMTVLPCPVLHLVYGINRLLVSLHSALKGYAPHVSVSNAYDVSGQMHTSRLRPQQQG